MTFVKTYTDVPAEDNLQTEDISQNKSECSKGEFYSIEDKSEAHDTIVVNAIALLKAHLRSIGYRIHTGSIRVNIDDRGNIFYYPDLSIASDRQAGNYQYFKHQPYLIVEVTSPETEVFDRGEKFTNYRKIDTLQEYVLISEDRVNVECFRRNREGDWLYYSYRKGEEIYLASIDFRTPISTLYEDVIIASLPKYICQPKIQSEHYIRFSNSTTICASESPTHLQLPTQLPVTKLQKPQKLKPHILIGLGTALILGFAGSQIYKFSHHRILGKSKLSSAVPENVKVISSKEDKTISTKIIDESQKARKEENNFNFQIEWAGELGAKKAIGLINRMQKGFFSENDRFASNWQDLGLQVKSKEGEYEYKIIWSDRIKTIVTATANKPDLKSYTGVVIVLDESAMDKICETNETSNTPPVINEITSTNLECPAGSSSVAAIF